MNTVASTLALLCITLIGTASFAFVCNNKECTRFCNPNKCSPFSCDAKACTQGCLGTACKDMTCTKHTTNCTQFCDKCKGSNMICASTNCIQSCDADFCEMECTRDVETCQQVCKANSTCKITCHNDTTDCQLSCDGANCTGLPEKPKVSQSCDELTGNCTRTCTGGCGENTVSCGDGKFKECYLSCQKGCKMVCDKTVQKCVQTCIGDTPCTSVCDAASCQKIGKFRTPPRSSAMVCHLNYVMFVLFACIMIFQLKNL